jgi:hypothetical protein
VRLRGSGDQVPERLLRYRPGDWPSPLEWSRERRAWLRRHARTVGDVDRLYGPDVEFPPEVDPRVERRLAVALHPTLHGVDG